MDNGSYTAKQTKVLQEVKRILDELFPAVEKLPEPDPICYKCNVVMCEVFPAGRGPSYWECFEHGCHHKEWSV